MLQRVNQLLMSVLSFQSFEGGPFSELCVRLGRIHDKHNKREIVFRGSVTLSDECALELKRQLPDMSGLTTTTRRKLRHLLLRDRDGVRRYAPPLLFTTGQVVKFLSISKKWNI